MSDFPSEALPYKRSRFSTRLPVGFLYSPSHSWLARRADGSWRVGLTKFATRMLGEMVDHGFETSPGQDVHPGQILGWIEGFKAISDIYCVGHGEFAGPNPALPTKIQLVSKDPYDGGWLYEMRGTPDDQCLDVHQYAALLDSAIDRILAQEKAAE